MYESKHDHEFQTRAYVALRRFLRNRTKPFLAEEFRAWLERTLPEHLHPNDWRSLGHTIKSAKAAGLIDFVGSAPARTSHGNWKPKWVGCK